MQVHAHPTDATGVAAFTAAVRPVLEADRDAHTVALSILDSITVGVFPAAVLVSVHEHGRCTGGLLGTPGRPVLVSALADRHAEPVVAALVEAGVAVSGASGPVAAVESFGRAWVARTGAAARELMRLRLFALAVLAVPTGVPGVGRAAGPDDVALLASWRDAFADEVDLGHRDPIPAAQRLPVTMASGSFEWLWTDRGEVVAQAAARRPMAGMTRIGPVYTAPQHRGRGYGAAVTAALTAAVLDAGADRVLLFTDLANPTTNRLYPRLGFRPVHDALDLEFTPALPT